MGRARRHKTGRWEAHDFIVLASLCGLRTGEARLMHGRRLEAVTLIPGTRNALNACMLTTVGWGQA